MSIVSYSPRGESQTRQERALVCQSHVFHFNKEERRGLIGRGRVMGNIYFVRGCATASAVFEVCSTDVRSRIPLCEAPRVLG